jgi:hypothetical protein
MLVGNTNDTRRDLRIIHALQAIAQPGKFRGLLIPKITHTYTRKYKMTTSTLNTYYCAFCAAVSKSAKATFTKFMAATETIGTARAATELARLGYHKEARALMLGKNVEDI